MVPGEVTSSVLFIEINFALLAKKRVKQQSFVKPEVLHYLVLKKAEEVSWIDTHGKSIIFQ